MSGASIVKFGITLGLVGALVYGLWYANQKGMFRSGPDLSNTHWFLEGQGLNDLTMTFNTAKPGGNLAMTWGRSRQITGTYRQSRVKFVVDGQMTSFTFEGVVNRAGTIIEGDVTLASDPAKVRHFVARRVNQVTYDKPKFLLHIQAVATPRTDGQGSEWTTNMYFAGMWVTTTREPDRNGQVQLTWLSALPVTCLADQKYGPFNSSLELCPKLQEVGATVTPEALQELGCTG